MVTKQILDYLFEYFPDPPDLEKKLLRQLCRENQELPQWAAGLQRILDSLSHRNLLKRSLKLCVLKMPLNALALPHETIVMAKSLVSLRRDYPDQLAFVLAHEAAHIELGHAREKTSLDAITNLVTRANPPVGCAMQYLLGRAFSREQEFEADRLAIEYCRTAGYNPRAGIAFMEWLQTIGDDTGVIQLMSTHPPLGARVTRIKALTDD